VQKMGALILAILNVCDIFLHKLLPFVGQNDCTCVKISSGVNFLIVMNSLMH